MPDKKSRPTGAGTVAIHQPSDVTTRRPTTSQNLRYRSRSSGKANSARRRFRRLVARATAASLLLVSLTMTGAPPAVGAEGPPESACPEMTDSIRRLHLALFLREPDLNEAFHWTDRYKSGEANLASIANELARSTEFDRQHGPKTSSQFVELLYNNTRNPPPSQQILQHWTRALNTGYTRGEMVLVLTESEAFVRKTATARPLSGYLRWYPPGTHWYCGRGTVEGLSIKPLTGDRVYADRLIRNEGDTPDDVVMVTLESGLANAVMARSTLPPRVTDYSWMGTFAGDGYYGGAVTVGAGPSTRWIIVFYPRSIGHNRLGWQIGPAPLPSNTGR